MMNCCKICWTKGQRTNMVQASLNDYQEPLYRDNGWLEEKYVRESLTLEEISDMLNCSTATVSKWLKRHGIDSRAYGPRSGRQHPRWNEFATFVTNQNGYEKWSECFDNQSNSVSVSRLAAVAWFGWDAVVDKEVHHRIPIPWLNIESNIIPLPFAEHRIMTGKYSQGIPRSITRRVERDIGK